MTTPADNARRKPMGEVCAYDHAARLFGVPEPDAGFPSRQTDCLACRAPGKTAKSPGSSSKKTVIWRIPAKMSFRRIHRVNEGISRMITRGRASILALTIVVTLLIATVQSAQARIIKIVITTTTSPAFNGRSFGGVGQYEQLDGIAYGEVDPRDPQNAIIQDIALAPVNRNGKVEYSMDISILKPIDHTKGDHVLLYEAVNRGNKFVPGTFNVETTDADPAGDGFLENNGFTLVWSGWQADLVPSPATGRIAMTVPVAHFKDGTTITGTVRSEISTVAPIQTSRIFGQGFSANSRGYLPVSTDTSNATLTQRVHAGDARVPIPASQWAFGSCNPVFPNVIPDPPNTAQFHICKQGGFDSNHLYELVYQAQDPLVLGLGFAATRDLVSYLHHAGAAQNPLNGTIEYTLVHGTSQAGNYLRSFLQLGFNRDEQGSIVFEGMNPHVAPKRKPLNVRFGDPGRAAGLQHTENDFAGEESPVTWNPYDDPVAKVSGGLLDRCRATRTCPKILQTVTDTEYWQGAMSLTTTDVAGQHDLNVPDNVRIYHFASTQHGGYSPVGALPPAATPVCQQLPNANSYNYAIRAILIALRNWVVQNAAPPPSRYARIADGTLIDVTKLGFPTIPKVSENVKALLNDRVLYNRGATFDGANESGYESIVPPVRIGNYVTLVPKVNSDGNDVDGVPSLSLMAPLGTYTGWNTRAVGFGEGDACDLIGSFIPFPKTDPDATASGDPRQAIASRYPSTEAYDRAIVTASRALVAQGFLLASDAAAAVLQAETQAHKSGLLPP
jgi:hypothetical protein